MVVVGLGVWAQMWCFVGFRLGCGVSWLVDFLWGWYNMQFVHLVVGVWCAIWLGVG